MPRYFSDKLTITVVRVDILLLNVALRVCNGDDQAIVLILQADAVADYLGVSNVVANSAQQGPGVGQVQSTPAEISWSRVGTQLVRLLAVVAAEPGGHTTQLVVEVLMHTGSVELLSDTASGATSA